ncbi:hypothetical protein BJX96DRAFT_157040 [Aspergillus floccosus]
MNFLSTITLVFVLVPAILARPQRGHSGGGGLLGGFDTGSWPSHSGGVVGGKPAEEQPACTITTGCERPKFCLEKRCVLRAEDGEKCDADHVCHKSSICDDDTHTCRPRDWTKCDNNLKCLPYKCQEGHCTKEPANVPRGGECFSSSECDNRNLIKAAAQIQKLGLETFKDLLKKDSLYCHHEYLTSENRNPRGHCQQPSNEAEVTSAFIELLSRDFILQQIREKKQHMS